MKRETYKGRLPVVDAASLHDDDIYENVAPADVRPGDVVHLPACTDGGKSCGWTTRPVSVRRPERITETLWSFWLTPGTVRPGDSASVMICGHECAVGVLRRRHTTS